MGLFNKKNKKKNTKSSTSSKDSQKSRMRSDASSVPLGTLGEPDEVFDDDTDHATEKSQEQAKEWGERLVIKDVDIELSEAPSRLKLDKLPLPLLQLILSHTLDARTLCIVAQVSKRFNVVASSNELWRMLSVARWPALLPDPSSGRAPPKIRDWRRFFRKRMFSKRFSDDSDLSPIESCTFAFKCPMSWEELRITSEKQMSSFNNPEETVRHCEKCDRHVHFVSNKKELEDARALGWCVALGSQAEITARNETLELLLVLGEVGPPPVYMRYDRIARAREMGDEVALASSREEFTGFTFVPSMGDV